MVIEGNALYYLEAGYAWRNKRPDVFLSPRIDRDWVASDSAIDYVMYQLKDIRAAVDASNARRNLWRRPTMKMSMPYTRTVVAFLE